MEIADYRRIANDIQEQIRSGVLRPGDKLSTTAQLAEHYQVSVSTAYRAVSLLHDRDLVVGHIGRGVFVKSSEPG